MIANEQAPKLRKLLWQFRVHREPSEQNKWLQPPDVLEREQQKEAER